MKHRVFLDANILFSGAWLEGSGLNRLWLLPEVALITSRYAVAEAERNLDTDAQRVRLQALAAKLSMVDAPQYAVLPAGVELVAKDTPILLAAIEARATHLLTGDRAHFGALYRKTVAGVKILPPAEYFKLR
ncbi:MAG: DNA-binding protein [Betaproteobacteria bacterium]|nr:DNA-binding protein [Betaproteobacteria bacterium]